MAGGEGQGWRPKRVGVVGGGIMGQGIAALFANEGVDVTIFDVTEAQAQGALEKLGDPDQKLPQLHSPRALRRIQARTTAQYPEALPACDAIVEVVPEVMGLKKKVLAAIDAHRAPGSVVSTNTSGLSVAGMAEGLSADLRACFLGTHYFHPVRYLPLVELIPTADTRPDLVAGYAQFFRRAGKRPVVGRDTPNFIANRVGIHAMMKTLQLALKLRLPIELVDLVTGPPLGHPKTGTFRLADMVGLDTLVHATRNSHDNCPDDESRGDLVIPALLERLVAEGRLGEKTGAGFYKKQGKEILALDLETLEYRPKLDPRSDCVRVAKGYKKAADRVRAMVEATGEPAAALARELVLASGAYALRRVGEIAGDAATIDDAMCGGFGRELGPIACLDAVGLGRAAALMEELRIPVPALLTDALGRGLTSFYGEDAQGRTTCFDAGAGARVAVPEDPRALSLPRLRRRPGAVVRENLNARLVDLGDGVLLFEPDVKLVPAMNPIDDWVLSMLAQAHEEVGSGRFRALVLGNQAPSFCAGANLKAVLELARAKRFSVIEAMARTLQGLNLRGLHAPYPVVAAPHGMTLGGGLELALGAQVRVALAETYAGLVEVGVGLVPAGGGCLRLLQTQGARKNERGGPLGPMQCALAAFDLIGMARVSTSGRDAVEKGLLEPDDVVVSSKAEQLRVAKEVALARLEGFAPRPEQPVALPGEGGYLVMADTIQGMLRGGKIGPHAARIATIQARILSGGPGANMATPLTEQQVCDLEVEAFLELCAEPLTQARMQHMLDKGKPLFN